MADKKEVKRLIRDLSDRNSEVQFRVAMELGELGDRSVVPALMDALSDWKSYEVRSGFATALGQLGDTSTAPALIGAISDEDEEVRSSTAWALGEFGDTSAVPALIEALSDWEDRVCSETAKQLGKLGDASAVPALIGALSDPEELGRSLAAKALESLSITSPSKLGVMLSTRETQLVSEEFSSTQGSLANDGEGPAFNVSLNLSGPAVGNPQKVEVSSEIKAGSSVTWTASVQSTASGPSAPLHWELKFDDLELKGTEYVQVSRPETTPSSTTIVSGDLLGAGAVKQGEGVVVQKGDVS